MFKSNLIAKLRSQQERRTTLARLPKRVTTETGSRKEEEVQVYGEAVTKTTKGRETERRRSDIKERAGVLDTLSPRHGLQPLTCVDPAEYDARSRYSECWDGAGETVPPAIAQTMQHEGRGRANKSQPLVAKGILFALSR